MNWLAKYPVRRDSKSIALLAVFTAMVVVLEVFPIPGITDLKFYPEGVPFTIDWTGIPLIIIFIGLGFAYSLLSVLMMFIAIAYRNFPGAVFKGFAEFFTIVGLVFAKLLIRERIVDKKRTMITYLVFGIVFRSIGMFVMNIVLLPIFYPLWYTIDHAVVVSGVLVPWNMAQAIINIVGGVFLYNLIPENLALQAGLGDGVDSTSSRVEDLSLEELAEAETEQSDG
ncbi:MAG: hypothetical protein ACFE7R_08555 [Candidatus Hodarchaeota archaeon]